ncbi:hypothetical protein BFP72_16905 [Reichenbachiella sp. 5M10]|uniref:ATP-binding protein n=1 Tax=Reichenbachiella sp. 5M10 TaxID=1889772 RepID=UPI000C15CB77|nr:ATP-binding protein [Reichenbachiella sp. 5M10]PIB36963.1 hypothetical protein BFP72_16905 [Reichenbachiella sp. 5M10]
MEHSNRTDTQTKRKVWVLFLITGVITGCICFASYESFVGLTQSIDQLSQPDDRVELINETFQEIVEAENNIQSYILSGDPNMEKQYLLHSKYAKYKIHRLKNRLREDSVQYARVDSLETLFETKLLNLEAFLKIKNRRQQAVFTGEALDEIQRQLNDSTVTEQQLLRQEIFEGEFVPTERQQVQVVEDDYRGVKGFFRKMLGGDNSYLDTVMVHGEELQMSKVIRIDTSVVRGANADTTLREVKTILTEVLKKEKRIKRQMSAQELAMLRQDMAFIANIRSIIFALKQKEKQESKVSNELATQKAARSTMFIISIGFVGLLMSGAFLFLILKDITGAYFYRAQLEKEKIRAEKLAQAKEDFLSNMSHEIRTPLQSIKGFAELIGQTSMTDKQAKFLRAIRYSNDYLSELINDVLDQAKIESGMLEFEEEPFDMCGLIDELETVYGKACEAKGISLYADISGLGDWYLLGDSVKLKQVLINLLSNAIKFTKEGHVRLQVLAEQTGETMALTMTVTDTGTGISDEMQPVIFDQFTQEVNTESKNYRGTGLGLSIAKSLVEAMGGEISLTSELGKGSVFEVRLKLPFVEGGEEENDDMMKVPVGVKFAVRVMVVEDDDWNGTLLREVLLQHVDEVQVFQDAELALAYFDEYPTSMDLVFSDIKMVGMDGVEFLREIRKRNIHIPVIALTAHVQTDKLTELKSEGFDEVYSKPYETKDIQQILMGYFVPVDQEQVSETVTSISGEGVFDFSVIRRFAGDDEETFHRLLSSLLANNQRQLAEYEAYLNAQDTHQLGELCHQMKTTYDNLGLSSISESLASIELHEQLGQTDRIVSTATDLLPDLYSVFENLKKDLKSRFDIS